LTLVVTFKFDRGERVRSAQGSKADGEFKPYIRGEVLAMQVNRKGEKMVLVGYKRVNWQRTAWHEGGLNEIGMETWYPESRFVKDKS
jgi:hypothetical protein